MAKHKIVGPSIHRQSTAAGLWTAVIPAGEVWEILSIRSTFVTLDHNLLVTVDGRRMLWGPADASGSFFHTGNTVQDYRSEAACVEHSERMIPLRVMEHQTLNIQSDDLSGFVAVWYRIYTMDAGWHITDDGFTNGRNRTLHTWGYRLCTVAANAVIEFVINISRNPPGTLLFPWSENAPAQRDYELLSFLNMTPDSPIGQTWIASIRILHEGREIITPAGIPQGPLNIFDFTTLNPHTYFPLPAYLVDQYENLQVLYTIGNGPAQSEDVPVRCGFIMIEREKKEIYP
jgi:hypothetical protein